MILSSFYASVWPWGTKNGKNPYFTQDLIKDFEIYEFIDLIVTLPLLLFVCFFFTCATHTMNRCAGDSEGMNQAKKQMKYFYGWMMCAYSVRLLYALLGIGKFYDNLVC